MKTRVMTAEQISSLGLKALAEALGPVEMVRFLQQFETGSGDNTKDRERWLEQTDVDTLADEIQWWRATQNP